MISLAHRHIWTVLLLLPALAFLAVWFAVPLAQLFGLSLAAPGGWFAAYSELLTGTVYTRVFVNTLLVAVNVTVVCVLLAYPTAYLMSRLQGVWLLVTLYCVLFPLWISVLVRTFCWMLLLERNGPINRLLIELSLAEQPLQLLFNNVGVHIGMVHVLLPYAVLPMYAAMVRIDRNLLLASDGLGARLSDTFFRVYLPLSMPGVAGGAGFVFLLSLGFFITPALLGGINAITLSMLIENLVNERLAWSLAAAASFLLLFAVLLLLAAGARFLSLGRGLAP
jgi:putative spermidine/putrescine transport system permease protein